MNTQVEIILVEDNLSDAELAIRALKKNHIVNQLIHLKDGAEALDFIFGEGSYSERKTLTTPKVILLDLKMPKIGGMEVLQRLKSDARTKKIPVIILTSSKEDPDISVCYEMGANSYVVKPVKFDEFSRAVNELGLYWMLLNESPV
jgi:two-component system response regulator